MRTQDEDLAEIRATQTDITEILADISLSLRRIKQGVDLLLNHHGIEVSK
jgi:hypothetical protein